LFLPTIERDFHLNGRLPSELTILTALSELSLEKNQLSGDFPIDLVGLPLLEAFRVRGNNLTGNIPPGIFRSWSSVLMD
jgi:hypothetical protein